MNPVLALLALVAVALAGLIAYEASPAATLPDDAPARPPLAATAPAGTASPETAAASRSAFVETLLGRPLFSHSRRPPDVAAPGTAATSPTMPLPRMTGILIDGPRRSAIFAASAGGKPVVVLEGGHLGPFTIQSIQPQQVVVLGPDGRRVVHTSFDPDLPAPAAMVPIVAPQFPGILLPNGSPVTSPGGRLPGSIPQFPQAQFPQAPPGAGYGAAR